jgi:hypothetical protein
LRVASLKGVFVNIRSDSKTSVEYLQEICQARDPLVKRIYPLPPASSSTAWPA